MSVKKVSGWKMKKKGLEGFMATNDEEAFLVLEENDVFIARKVSGRNFRFKKRKRETRKQQGQSPTRWLQTFSDFPLSCPPFPLPLS